MVPTCLVVADTHEAIFYRVTGTRLHPELERVERIEFSAGLSASVVEQRQVMHGSFVDRNGSLQENRRFAARRIQEELLQLHQRGDCRGLIVAAPPALLGVLRERYASRVAVALQGEIIGEFVKESPTRLARRVRDLWNASTIRPEM